MAIKLSKTIVRELLSTDRKGKPIIIELEGGDMLTFRLKGSPKRYSIFLGHCFRLAQIFQADSDYREKMKDYQAKKKMGMKRLRKPKQSSLPYNNVYFKALKS